MIVPAEDLADGKHHVKMPLSTNMFKMSTPTGGQD